jgi:hypothetical protein
MPNDCHNRLIVDQDFALGGVTTEPDWVEGALYQKPETWRWRVPK